MLPALIPLIGSAISGITSLISEGIEDKDKAKEIEAKARDLLSAEFGKVLEAQHSALLAELQGNWLQRSWRPLLMLTVVAIVFNNYVLFPYLQMMFDTGVVLDLPDKLWNLLTIGVGGYIVGRSGEKIVKDWKGKSDG